MKKQFEIKFIPSGRGKATEKSDPAFPNGVFVDTGIKPACEVTLPYPAPECGGYYVKCLKCEMTCFISAVGRPDDPIGLMLPCDVDILKRYETLQLESSIRRDVCLGEFSETDTGPKTS